MYNFIRGFLVEKSDGFVVLDNNGIGYEILVSNNTLGNLPLVGEEIMLHTYLQVREDGISLLGFLTKEEKNLFLQLITVSGIGPKSALGILSGASVEDIKKAIFKEDVNLLAKTKGLGKKSAERIIVELKDKINVDFISSDEKVGVETTIDDGIINDCVEVLISLGLNKNEALRLVKANYKENLTSEEIIAGCLRNMG